jgi:S-adenosylmethionine decarboxylase
MSYQPGTHIIASLQTKQIERLNSFELFKNEIDRLVNVHQLVNLGEVYHNFTPAGFTAVICLSESHISVHTWPEYGKVNLDIYLSNYQRNNDQTVSRIYGSLLTYFNADEDHCETIYR